jgi:hypothetical protein
MRGRERRRPLFELLVASLLFSARIDATIAVEASSALRRRGWRTAQKMADSTWKQRVEALNAAGYTHYQERTSTMLGETAETLLEDYSGDLRRLREEAERDAGRERELLKRFNGVGDVGVDIFFREVQVAWEEVAPFADRRARRGRALGARQGRAGAPPVRRSRRFPAARRGARADGARR